MGISLLKRARVEIDIVPIEEVFRNVRWLIRIAGIFRISSYVDSTKSDLSAVGISEATFFNRKS